MAFAHPLYRKLPNNLKSWKSNKTEEKLETARTGEVGINTCTQVICRASMANILVHGVH